MSKPKRDHAELRRRAEERLQRSGARPRTAPRAEPQRLLHELKVHQVELELQNDELRSSRLEVERALERYTQLFHYAPFGYLVLRNDGVILNVNLAGAKLIQLERRGLVGRSVFEFLRGGDVELFRRNMVAIVVPVPGEERVPDGACEVTLHLPSGEERRVRVTASDVSITGVRVEVLLAIEDITARRRAEEVLQEESRHKDAFLATLSHELRNPLGPMRNGLYILEHVPSGGDESRKALAVIDRQLGHLTRIVEDLLDVTRIARGKIHVERAPLELGELVRRTTDDHRAGFEARGLMLDAHLDGAPCWVDGDTTRLAQVLGNLLGNAEKFTPRGGRVEVALRREGPAAVITVRDTGVGIDPAVRAHLFEPFSQGPQSLARSRGGLGLGLAMVKGLVELHGGSIDLASEGAGRGAEVTVRLPAISPPGSASRADGPHAVVRHRVLVIEDNEDAATSLKQVLELSGHEVHVAPDGPTGLALAHVHRPEIVICDIGLPGMDGYQVARKLRAETELSRPYLIALTGYARPEDVRRAADAGFDRHVAKPPPLGVLEAMMAEVPVRSEAGRAQDAPASRPG